MLNTILAGEDHSHHSSRVLSPSVLSPSVLSPSVLSPSSLL